LPNYIKGKKKAAAAKKGHRNTTTRKSHRGVRVAAWKRWGKKRGKKK
jgi:hypothetical protein